MSLWTSCFFLFASAEMEKTRNNLRTVGFHAVNIVINLFGRRFSCTPSQLPVVCR